MIVKPQEFTYDLCKKYVADFRSEYDFADFEVIGRSWTGRALFSLSIGEGTENVLFLGGMRGQESVTSLVLLKFFERLCDAYKYDKKISAVKIRNSLTNRKITIVPLANPDSVEIVNHKSNGAGCYAGLVSRAAAGDYSSWNANARGVDISHNFNYHHERIIYENLDKAMPSPYRYAGPSPESEPETKAIAKLCENNLFRYAFCMSSGCEQIYWSENNKENLSETAMMAKVLSSVSGYPLCRKEEKERYGTFGEWFSAKHHRPAFEIKTGKLSPTPIEEFNFIYNRIEEMLTLGAIM